MTSAQASELLARHGPNQITTSKRLQLVWAFLARLRNPLILVLIAAASIAALSGDSASFAIIIVMVLLSIVLDVFQEYRASDAAAKLRARVSLTATVVRDGQIRECPAAGLVPGDVVLLAAGDLVPADGRLLECRDLYVNEALLTGESYPLRKQAAPDEAGLMAMGSSVVSGTGRMLLTETGIHTRLGDIARSLQKTPPAVALERGLNEFARMIVRITLMLVLFTLLVNLMFHRPALQSFLFAVALAVGLTPELLPMVVSVTLAQGALRLSRKEAIVKRLSAIHDLGSMDVLCSDKTGTLTLGRIELACEIDVRGNPSRSVLELARVNAQFETGLKSPIDLAILDHDTDAGIGWRKLDELPFDFERRRVSVLAESPAGRRLIVKGSPEELLNLSTHFQDAGGVSPFDTESRARALLVLSELEAKGLRTLGVAWHRCASDCVKIGPADESDLVLAGFLGFMDPPKPGLKEVLAELKRLGVGLKILTGDSVGVTQTVCAALGLPHDSILTGADLDKLSDEALAARLAYTNIFCRVSPQQKLRILAALRRQDHVVGYLGDGINDAPSLHEADVGLSVEGAVDVAREAASIILLRKDLAILTRAVLEGRRTFANVFKYVLMGTSSNFGNMFSMAGGSLLLPFLPLLPTQILLNNFLYDLSETAIPLDRVDADLLMRPRHWNISQVRRFMLIFGPLSSLFDFLTFYVLLRLFHADQALFQTGWFVESLATQVLVIFIIRTAHPWRSRPHPLLAAAAAGVIAIGVLIPFSPAAAWLKMTPLSAGQLSVLAVITISYLAVIALARHWFFFRTAPDEANP